MADKIGRRSLLKQSVLSAAGMTLGMSLEERALLAMEADEPAAVEPDGSQGPMPMGRIGNLKISRMLCGGNLTSGFAHSRDLIYVSSLLRNYFTDEKIFETWEICEECGINSVILRVDDSVIRLINKYWKERGGSLQWIAQIKPPAADLTTDIKRAVDNGAVGLYLQGGVGDKLVREGRIDLVAKALEYMKEQGVIAGIGAHCLEVVVACEKAGLEPDFYMKTLHRDDYFSATPEKDRPDVALPPHDNMWCTKPEETIAFMKNVRRPWIAFKVLAAGAIAPGAGFKYAFENGSDFVCVGMFDFQVREDVIIALDVLSGRLDRSRAWVG